MLLALVGSSTAAPTTGLAISTRTPGGWPEKIPATLDRPEGTGPFPAVVIMHDCSGLGPVSSGAPGRWARELVDRGYAVLVPDSFSTRGHPSGVCIDPSRSRDDVSPARRVHDAVAALAHLRTLDFIDGKRVGLMGGSHGGSTTLATMATREGAGFAAAIALYPSCAPSRRTWSPDLSGVYRPAAPLLILIGERDDWTPVKPCEELTRRAQAAGYPVSIKVYPGAQHAFDSNAPTRYLPNRRNANSETGRGATTGGDPAAWADAIKEVTAFFAKELKE